MSCRPRRRQPKPCLYRDGPGPAKKSLATLRLKVYRTVVASVRTERARLRSGHPFDTLPWGHVYRNLIRRVRASGIGFARTTQEGRQFGWREFHLVSPAVARPVSDHSARTLCSRWIPHGILVVGPRQYSRTTPRNMCAGRIH